MSHKDQNQEYLRVDEYCGVFDVSARISRLDGIFGRDRKVELTRGEINDAVGQNRDRSQ